MAVVVLLLVDSGLEAGDVEEDEVPRLETCGNSVEELDAAREVDVELDSVEDWCDPVGVVCTTVEVVDGLFVGSFESEVVVSGDCVVELVVVTRLVVGELVGRTTMVVS